MMQVYLILSIAMATLCSQATGDIAALEKKIKLLETRIRSIQAIGEKNMEMLERRLGRDETRHDTKMAAFNTRLEHLESKSFSCSECRFHSFDTTF